MCKLLTLTCGFLGSTAKKIANIASPFGSAKAPSQSYVPSESMYLSSIWTICISSGYLQGKQNNLAIGNRTLGIYIYIN